MRKYITVVAILAIMSIALYIFFGQNDQFVSIQKNNDNVKTEVSKLGIKISVDILKLRKKNTRALAESMVTLNPTVSLDDALEMLEWQYDRGYPRLDVNGKPINSDYDLFDLDQLKSLADNGDIYATHLLGQKLFKRGNFNEAEEYFWTASVNGLTYSLMELANIYVVNSRNEAENSSKKDHLIKAYSLLDVALNRGDLMAKFSMKVYGFKPDEEERKKIHIMSREYYSKLVSERRTLSLNEFDNTTPIAINYILKNNLNIEN